MNLIALPNFTGGRSCYVNAVPSTAITNTTTETILDSCVYTLPAQSVQTILPNTLLRYRLWGVYSSGLLNLGLTLRVRWGGLTGQVLGSTGGLSLVSSQTNAGWTFTGAIVLRQTGSSASLEAQGFADFQGSALANLRQYNPNTTPFTISTVTSTDMVWTVQWATASAANSMTAELLHLEIDTL